MTIVAVAALVLLLIATYLLFFGLYLWDAGLFLFLSLFFLFVVFVRRRESGHRVVFHWRLLQFWKHGGWLRVLAVLMSVWVGLASRFRPASFSFADLLLLWLLAIGLFIASLYFPKLWTWLDCPWREKWSLLMRSLRHYIERLRASRDLPALVAIFVVALLVRGVAVGKVPTNLSGDEGTQLIEGLRLATRPVGNPFATGWYSVPTMSFLAYGMVMRVLGASVWGGRALSVIVGSITVLTTFWLAYTLGGRRVGWASALTVCFSAYHIHFSRVASNQIMDPLIATLAIWLLCKVLQEGGESDSLVHPTWGLVGLVAGLGWYAYFGARWVTFLIAFILIWRALQMPGFIVRQWRGLLWLALGWLTVTIPLLAWYTVHPSALYERYTAVGIFPSGWLAREVAITGKSTFALIVQQFVKAITAFHLTPDPTFWYGPRAPLLDFISGALMLVGLLATLVHWRWPSRALTLIWFCSTLVVAWVMTENPPSSQRGLLLVPAVALFVGWGIDALWRLFSRNPDVLRAAFVACVFLVAVLNLTFYFGVYTPRRSYGNPTALFATEIVHFFRENPLAESKVYFLGPPFMYWDFGAFAFLLRDQPGINVPQGEVPLGVSGVARFVFAQPRLNELDVIRATYPDGKVTQIIAPDGAVIGLVYDWNY